MKLLTIKTSCYVFPATSHVLGCVAETTTSITACTEGFGLLLRRTTIMKEMRITATTTGLRKRIHFVHEGDALVFTVLADKLKENTVVHM